LLIPIYLGGLYEAYVAITQDKEDKYIRWKVLTVWVALLILGFMYKIWM
jgi:hypothetical protein